MLVVTIRSENHNEIMTRSHAEQSLECCELIGYTPAQLEWLLSNDVMFSGVAIKFASSITSLSFFQNLYFQNLYLDIFNYISLNNNKFFI